MNGNEDILVVCLLIVNFFRATSFIFLNPITQLKKDERNELI